MAKRTRKTMTPEGYNSIKKVYEALKQAQDGKAPSGSEIARITGFSDTTISRALLTNSFEEYQDYQRTMAHGKPKEEKPVDPQPVEETDLGKLQLALVKKSIEIQDAQMASTLDHMAVIEKFAERNTVANERQADALEALVEAWNNSGKKGFLGR